MTVLYVSPHLDDVAFSCAASLLQHKERVIVATVFSEGKGSAARRAEDRKALKAFEVVHLGFLDAPDRLRVKPSFTSLVLKPSIDRRLVQRIRQALTPLVHQADHAYFPLGIGGHIDHLTVFEAHPPGARFYEDRPYALAEPLRRLRLLELRGGSSRAPPGTFGPVEAFFEPGERAACVAELSRRLALPHPRRFRLRSAPRSFTSPRARALIATYRTQNPGNWNPLLERHFRVL
ncbi:MAG TPA: PIG-L family deacetylase [Myxococcales bacterium]|jgi:LmbE family N-acetylglucosaminyl deacetylase|nr:PIG-L family deacetylase [Myxococcales bacterium]